jgi:hypothetical protein
VARITMGTGQGHTLDMAGTPSHLAVYFRVALKTVLCLRGHTVTD